MAIEEEHSSNPSTNPSTSTFEEHSSNSKNGTKHLHQHLKCCIRRKNPDIRQKLLTNATRGNVDNFDQDVARLMLAKMIIIHEYPLSMVDHAGFRKYSSALQPLFKCPTRNTIKSDILGIYDNEKSKVMKILEGNKSRIAITTDMWTSSNQKKGFMAITAHFIDNFWTLQDYILRFVYVPSPHTSEVLARVLVDCFLDWNIDKKISTITLDNCTTNDAMVELVKDKLQVEHLLNGGAMLHMRCCAHILNLIVKDGLDVIKPSIEKVRDSVVYWTATPKRVEKFEESVRQLRIPYTKKLCLDCPTRWNSTYFMLETAIMYKSAFNRLRLRESQYNSLPSESEWELAQQICAHLKVFYSCTELFSGTKYPTANLYFKKICQIKLALTKWLSSDDETIEYMAEKMLGKYNKYWSVVHEIMGIATILDPRYKMSLLEYYFPKVFGDDFGTHIDNIRGALNDLMHAYQHEKCTTKVGSLESGDNSGKRTEIDALLGKRGFFSNDADEENLAQFLKKQKAPKSDELSNELEFYLKENSWPDDGHFDVLMWWKTMSVKFPTLQAIARDLLAIPVSTVAFESAFSTSGRLVSPHRSRLQPNTIEALMCTQSWLWSRVNEDASLVPCDYASIYEDGESDPNPDQVSALQIDYSS